MYHVFLDHFVVLHQKFGGGGGNLAAGLPLFPTVRGAAVAKLDITKVH